MGRRKYSSLGRVRFARLDLENLNAQSLHTLRSAPGKAPPFCILVSFGGIQSKATKTQQMCLESILFGPEKKQGGENPKFLSCDC